VAIAFVHQFSPVRDGSLHGISRCTKRAFAGITVTIGISRLYLAFVSMNLVPKFVRLVFRMGDAHVS
jgi:hypothetical protein